jgi:hypothetical protein
MAKTELLPECAPASEHSGIRRRIVHPTLRMTRPQAPSRNAPPVTHKATELVGLWHFVSLLIYRTGVAPITEKRKHRPAKKPKSNEPPLSPAAENLSLFPKPISPEGRNNSNLISSVTFKTATKKSTLKNPSRFLHSRKITSEDYIERRNNWLAPAGSLQERQMLEKLAKQQGLDEKFRALVYAYLANPDGFAERNALFWQAAKKQVLGNIVYEIALERHLKLSRPNEWIVACLISQGLKQEEIAPIIGMSLPTVEKAVASIKNIIMRDLTYDIEAVNLSQITRWFLGL